MPIAIRKLAPEEVAESFPARGSHMDLTAYIEALRGFQPGESAAVPMDGLTSRAIKRRFGQAALKIGLNLKWAKPAPESDELIFRVVDPATRRRRGNGRHAVAGANAGGQVARPRGRPKKVLATGAAV